MITHIFTSLYAVQQYEISVIYSIILRNLPAWDLTIDLSIVSEPSKSAYLISLSVQATTKAKVIQACAKLSGPHSRKLLSRYLRIIIIWLNLMLANFWELRKGRVRRSVSEGMGAGRVGQAGEERVGSERGGRDGRKRQNANFCHFLLHKHIFKTHNVMAWNQRPLRLRRKRANSG